MAQMRFLTWAVPLIALFLTGCVQTEGQKEAAIAQEILYCNELGAVTQDQIFQCRMRLSDQKAAASSRRRVAMQSFGQQLMASPPPPRIVNCTSRQQGVFVNTTCY